MNEKIKPKMNKTGVFPSGSRLIFDQDVLFEHLQQGMLVTSDLATAQMWKRKYAEEFAGKATVTTPEIYSLEQFLEHLGDELGLPVPLNQIQELRLWQKLIEEGGRPLLLPAHSLAPVASRSYAVMREYLIEPDELQGSEEASAFRCWIDGIKNELKTGPLAGRMLQADLADTICRLMQHVRIPSMCPGSLMFAGFDHPTPLQYRLFERFIHHGIDCSFFLLKPGKGLQQMLGSVSEATDIHQECVQTATSIASILKQRPQARIAVGVPDLNAYRASLDHALAACLFPEQLFSPECMSHLVDWPPLPLNRQPAIGAALMLLDLVGKRRWLREELFRLMMSPFFRGGLGERNARARLDVYLRQANRIYVEPNKLLRLHWMNTLPELRMIIERISSFGRGKNPAAVWIAEIDRLLADCGWLPQGNDRADVSIIWQVNAFRDELNRLIALDAVCPSHEWPDFLQVLHAAFSRRVNPVMTESPHVYVRSVEQMKGMQADVLFLLGCDDETWPLRSAPDPLIPVDVQRAHTVPCADASSAMQESERLLAELAAMMTDAQGCIHASFSRQRSGTEVGPAPWFVGCTCCGFAAPTATDPVRGWFASIPRESIEDRPIPLHSKQAVVHGGVSVLKHQSACPFRAAVQHRLNVASLDEPVLGMAPTERGILVHKVLELLWRRLHDHATLLETMAREEELDVMVEEIISTAWKNTNFRPGKDVQKVERLRLQKLLREWLDLESNRPGFTVVARERPMRLDIPIGDGRHVLLSIKIDRIDQDENGHCLILDYKTGSRLSPSNWTGERPKDPQLPVYALSSRFADQDLCECPAVDAVIFAHVRLGECGFSGAASENLGLGNVRPVRSTEDWQKQLEAWQQSVVSLARGWLLGVAEINPRDAEACQYCPLHAVCRIDERAMIAAGAEIGD